MSPNAKRLFSNVATVAGATPLLLWVLAFGSTVVQGKIVPGMAVGFSALVVMLASVAVGYLIAAAIALPARLYEHACRWHIPNYGGALHVS